MLFAWRLCARAFAILGAPAGQLQSVGRHAQAIDGRQAAAALARAVACRIDIAAVDHRLRQESGVDPARQLRPLPSALLAPVASGDVAVNRPRQVGLARTLRNARSDSGGEPTGM